jgi:hypothetical protein
MSEALTAALFLPLAALLLDPPRRALGAGALGIATAALFLVRPNAGAVALVLAAVSLALAARPLRIAPLLAGFVVLWGPLWWATRVPDDPFRGMAPAFITGSLDYGWQAERQPPSPEPPPFVQVHTALANWRSTFSEAEGDRGRQLAWRALHGLLGTDFYDARWSRAYLRATTSSRVVTPLLVLASIAALLAAPFRGGARVPKILGGLLVAAVIAQGLILGALPRLALPLLPAILLYGVATTPGLATLPHRLMVAALFVALVALVASQRQVLDWEWGRFEAPGVRIVQTIPRGALPRSSPAALHIRIAPMLLPSNAGLEVLGPDGERLFGATAEMMGPSSFLTVPLTEAVLAANRRGPVEFALVSQGEGNTEQFLVFPVVPPPWGSSARRDGSAHLSPSSGIARGSLDWWAHEGVR